MFLCSIGKLFYCDEGECVVQLKTFILALFIVQLSVVSNIGE